ncbi:MAG: hypothetical protein LAO78_09460 [Acidobacteriia bacterium]|nr:hypothetical protein [Terriglobia bacterium]
MTNPDELTANRVLEFYVAEKKAIQESQFGSELQWQVGLSSASFTEQELLREAAWVVLSAGFKESILRKAFSYISLCFCDWESARLIVENATQCQSTALEAFNNRAKIGAIVEIARIVNELGFEDITECILVDPVGTLQQLPYIGPITAYHLAKNLGFLYAKPDRHLTRLAAFFGFADAHRLCQVISENTSDPLNLVDLVLWRSAEQGRVPWGKAVPQSGVRPTFNC